MITTNERNPIMKRHTLAHTHTVEIDLTITGTYSPGYPETSPSYSCGGEPAEPDTIEDLSIAGASVIKWEYRREFASKIALEIDLLDGVNLHSPDIQRLFSNILAASDPTEDMLQEAQDDE